MNIWGDVLQFSGQLIFLAFICSAIFWGLASGSVAINAKSKQPLIHLVLGALLHFIWFIVVMVLYFISLGKRGKSQVQPIVQPQPSVLTGFEEW